MASNQVPQEKFKKHHFITITEFTRTVNSFRNLNDLSNFLTLTLMGKFLLSRCAFLICIKDQLKLFSSKGSDINIENLSVTNNSEIEKLLNENFIRTNNFQYYKLLNDNDRIIGVLLYSYHNKKINLSEDEQILFESLLSISTAAIKNLIFINELNEVNKKLQLKISHSRSLFELSKEFSLLLDEEDVFKFLSYTIMGNFLVNKFALITIQNDVKKILGSNFSADFNEALDRLDIEKIKSAVNLKNSNDEELKTIFENSEQVVLIVPLEIKNKQIGLMLCGNKLTNQNFTDDEVEFIESLGSIAAISLENIRLFKETLEKQRIEEDIRIAQEIQRNLFPSKFPDSNVFDFFGLNEPSKQVGGDYFDIFRINENQILILIADVVGKGIGASLVMSNLQAMVKTLTRTNFNLSEATKELNNLMKKNLKTGNFITFFWGILDEKEKTLEYVNAGHNPPILIRNSQIKRLDKGGIILGVLELNQNYESEMVSLNENDLICLFTDGFIEAVDKDENEFGEERFIEKLVEYKNLPLEIICNRLVEELISFSENSASTDDLTILLTRIKHIEKD